MNIIFSIPSAVKIPRVKNCIIIIIFLGGARWVSLLATGQCGLHW